MPFYDRQYLLSMNTQHALPHLSQDVMSTLCNNNLFIPQSQPHVNVKHDKRKNKTKRGTRAGKRIKKKKTFVINSRNTLNTSDFNYTNNDGRQRKTTVTNTSQDTGRQHTKCVMRNEEITIATWNVRTLNTLGKIENVIQEMKRFKINILGLAETRLKEEGVIKEEEFVLYYGGGKKQERGVGIALDKETSKCYLDHVSISDRVILLKLKGSPFNINIIQVYAPTSECDEIAIETFYQDIEKAIKQCKFNEIRVVMGDFNAKVGSQKVDNIIGPHGLGSRNERGERLIDWCRGEDLSIANTWFKNHDRRKWTWVSPGGLYKNQIDFILVQQRFRNLFQNAGTIPSADCNSDHRPVRSKMKIRLKKIMKKKKEPKLNLDLLRTDNDIKNNFKDSVKAKFDSVNTEETIDEYWNQISNCINDSVIKTVPLSKKQNAKQKWMNDNILEMMNERSKLDRNSNEYTETDKRIKQECVKAKENYIELECQKIERLKQSNSKQFFQSIQYLSGKRPAIARKCVKDTNGNILIEYNDILKRWAEYIENLYADEKREAYDNRESQVELTGPPILRDEVELACKEMKRGKAVGEDNLSIELFDALGELGLDILTTAINMIYERGVLPTALRQSVFITIPKKKGTIDCDQHRMISIMSQATKIILRIIMKRMRNKISPELGDEQFGFMKERGTVNAIYTLKTIMQRSIEKQKSLYLCFIDYSKAFDSVQHDLLFEILNKIGIDDKDLRIVKNLYYNQTACVKIDNETSEYFDIKKGVRQGCVLSPDLFNLYSEMIFREIDDMKGITVGGKSMNNIRYADDGTLMGYSPESVQNILDTLVNRSEEMGLNLNVKKTECMVVTKGETDKTFSLSSKGEEIKLVAKFKYLGAIITDDARDIEEIKQRIAIAKNAFFNLRPVLSNNHLKLSTRMNVAQTYVMSTLLYGCETWTIDKECMKRLEAFEMWVYRRMLKISWTDRITNEEVLAKVRMKRTLLETIRTRQLRFLGHVWRRDGMEKFVTAGMIEGKRARGRQRMTFLNNLRIAKSDLKSNTDFMRIAEDREEWRRLTGNVLQSTRH